MRQNNHKVVNASPLPDINVECECYWSPDPVSVVEEVKDKCERFSNFYFKEYEPFIDTVGMYYFHIDGLQLGDVVQLGNAVGDVLTQGMIDTSVFAVNHSYPLPETPVYVRRSDGVLCQVGMYMPEEVVDPCEDESHATITFVNNSEDSAIFNINITTLVEGDILTISFINRNGEIERLDITITPQVIFEGIITISSAYLEGVTTVTTIVNGCGGTTETITHEEEFVGPCEGKSIELTYLQDSIGDNADFKFTFGDNVQVGDVIVMYYVSPGIENEVFDENNPAEFPITSVAQLSYYISSSHYVDGVASLTAFIKGCPDNGATITHGEEVSGNRCAESGIGGSMAVIADSVDDSGNTYITVDVSQVTLGDNEVKLSFNNTAYTFGQEQIDNGTVVLYYDGAGTYDICVQWYPDGQAENCLCIEVTTNGILEDNDDINGQIVISDDIVYVDIFLNFLEVGDEYSVTIDGTSTTYTATQDDIDNNIRLEVGPNTDNHTVVLNTEDFVTGVEVGNEVTLNFTSVSLQEDCTDEDIQNMPAPTLLLENYTQAKATDGGSIYAGYDELWQDEDGNTVSEAIEFDYNSLVADLDGVVTSPSTETSVYARIPQIKFDDSYADSSKRAYVYSTPFKILLPTCAKVGDMVYTENYRSEPQTTTKYNAIKQTDIDRGWVVLPAPTHKYSDYIHTEGYSVATRVEFKYGYVVQSGGSKIEIGTKRYNIINNTLKVESEGYSSNSGQDTDLSGFGAWFRNTFASVTNATGLSIAGPTLADAGITDVTIEIAARISLHGTMTLDDDVLFNNLDTNRDSVLVETDTDYHAIYKLATGDASLMDNNNRLYMVQGRAKRVSQYTSSARIDDSDLSFTDVYPASHENEVIPADSSAFTNTQDTENYAYWKTTSKITDWHSTSAWVTDRVVIHNNVIRFIDGNNGLNYRHTGDTIAGMIHKLPKVIIE